MNIETSLSGGTITATAVLEDDGDPPQPVAPDEGTEVVWTVFRKDKTTVLHREPQPRDGSTYVLRYTPPLDIAEVIYIDVLMIRGGDHHRGRAAHVVTWVDR